MWPAEGGGVAVSCSVFKVPISTGRRLTPPVPMGYTHERPPRCGGGWTCTSGGLWPSALRVYSITSKHFQPCQVCSGSILAHRSSL